MGGSHAHLPVLEAYSDHASLLPLGTPLSRLTVCRLQWRLGGQGGSAASSFWASGKRESAGKTTAPPRLVFLVRAVHSPSLFSEPFASALVSLETDMLIFFCTIFSAMSELIINI